MAYHPHPMKCDLSPRELWNKGQWAHMMSLGAMQIPSNPLRLQWLLHNLTAGRHSNQLPRPKEWIAYFHPYQHHSASATSAYVCQAAGAVSTPCSSEHLIWQLAKRLALKEKHILLWGALQKSSEVCAVAVSGWCWSIECWQTWVTRSKGSNSFCSTGSKMSDSNFVNMNLQTKTLGQSLRLVPWFLYDLRKDRNWIDHMRGWQGKDPVK